MRDLASRLRDALRIPSTPELPGWLLLAGALGAWVPYLLERFP